MERKVFIKDQSTSGMLKEFVTDAMTLGELAAVVGSEVNLLKDVRVVCMNTRNDLVLESAALPAGDITLLVYPVETKSGAGKYDNWGFQQLRNECSKRPNISGKSGNYGTSKEMITKLEEDDKAFPVSSKSEVVTKEAVVSKLEGLGEITTEKIKEIKSAIMELEAGETVIIDSFIDRVNEAYEEIGKLIKNKKRC